MEADDFALYKCSGKWYNIIRDYTAPGEANVYREAGSMCRACYHIHNNPTVACLICFARKDSFVALLGEIKCTAHLCLISC